MNKVPLFDTILKSIGVDDHHQDFYNALIKRILNPGLPTRQFYKMLPKIEPNKRIMLSTKVNESLDILMWTQFLANVFAKNLSGRDLVLSMRSYGIRPRDLSIFSHLRSIEQHDFDNLRQLKSPLTVKQTESLVLTCLKKFKPLIRSLVFKKLSFLTIGNQIDLQDQFCELECFLIGRIYYFLPVHRDVDLFKVLNRSLRNHVLNTIQFYTSEKRSLRMPMDCEGTSALNTISTSTEIDNREEDLLEFTDSGIDHYRESNIRIDCVRQSELCQRELSVNERVVNEVLKILRNENSEYIEWYNKRYRTKFNKPSDVAGESNFLKTVSMYCRTSLEKLSEVLQTLKPDFMEILQC